MLGFDRVITVYNSYYDVKTGCDKYSRTIIEGCSWFSRRVTVAGNASFSRHDIHQIRIPENVKCEKDYVPPSDFICPLGQFTLKEGDKIVNGEALEEMVKGDSIDGKYADICTVKAVHDNRRSGFRHLFVEGA